MGDMTGLVNHLKEAMRQKESEYQSVWKEVKHFMPPLLSVKLCDQRFVGAATEGQMQGEQRTTDVSLRSGQH